MNQSSERAMTPKEQYDAQSALINKEHAEKNPVAEEQELNEIADDTEKILDDMESKELDKNVGAKKELVGPFTPAVDKATGKQRIEVSREQFEKHKADQAAQRALLSLKNAQAEHLNPKQKKTIDSVVDEFENGMLKDPVLLHLLKEKGKLSQEHILASKAINALQRQLLEQVAKVTNDLVKTKGAMESTDKMLLGRVKELATGKADEKLVEKE